MDLLDRIRAQFVNDHPLSMVPPSPHAANTYSILDRNALKLDAAPMPAPAPAPVSVPAPAPAVFGVAVVGTAVLGTPATQAMLSRFGLGEKTKVRQMMMTLDASDEFELVDG
jgi:hypothetical protein